VPGPQFPLYMLGRELQDLFPVAFLPRDHALAVAIMSYNGSMDFGLLGDYDAMHDLEAFGEMVDDSLGELLTAAKKRRSSNGRPKAPKPKPAAKKPAGAKPRSKSNA
jgi:diacylglycerol O-acyltransferase / wax synthase